jgi:hypothetical protein
MQDTDQELLLSTHTHPEQKLTSFWLPV